MDSPTQNVFRALVRALVNSGGLTPDATAELKEELMQIAYQAIEEGHEVEGRQTLNLAINIGGDLRSQAQTAG